MAPPGKAMRQQQQGTRSRPAQLAGASPRECAAGPEGRKRRRQNGDPARRVLAWHDDARPVAAGRELHVNIQPIRRVVTGHDAQGHAVVVTDGPAARVLHRPSRPGVALTDLWATSGGPAARADGDPVDRPVVLHPPPGGTVFRIIQFDPEDPGALAHADGATAFAAMGAAGTVVAGARHPYM